MNLNRKVFILAILFGGCVSLPSPSTGQQGQAEPNRGVRYRLVDLGTLGGAQRLPTLWICHRLLHRSIASHSRDVCRLGGHFSSRSVRTELLVELSRRSRVSMEGRRPHRSRRPSRSARVEFCRHVD